MGWLILLGVIALPVVEIALFVKSADAIGIGPTVLLALAAAFTGVALLRAQGLTVLLRAREQMGQGEMPMREVFDTLCLAFAGVMLVLPGFLTDAVGILLLLPPVRAGLYRWLGGRLHAAVVTTGSRRPPSHPPVIESEYQVIDKDHE